MRTIPVLAACALIATLVSPARAETNSSLSISLEGIYWRPAGLDFTVIQGARPPGFINGAAQGIEYDFGPGYRFTIERQNLRARWTDLQTQSNFNAQCPSGTGNCMKNAQRGSSGNLVGFGAASASSWSGTRLQMLDLDFLRPIGAGSESSFTASFGLRYARIYNGTDTSYVVLAFGSDDMQSRTVNNMFGLRTGLEAEYQLRPSLRLTSSAAVSILSGRSHSDATENGSTGAGTFTQVESDYNTVSPAFELGLNITYTPIKDCDAWLGFDFIQFNDGLVKQSFSGTPAGIDTQITRQNVAFMGPRLGLRWRFF